MHWIMTEDGPFNLSCPDPSHLKYPYSDNTWYIPTDSKMPFKRSWPGGKISASKEPFSKNTWRTSSFYNDGVPYKSSMKVGMAMPDYTPEETPPWNVLDYVRVYSAPHGMDTLMPLLKMELHLDAPEQNTYSFGFSRQESFAAKTASANAELLKKINDVPEISSVLQMARDNATSLIKAATNGYVTLHQTDAGYVDEIIIADEEDYTKAKRVWRWNVGGLGFSNTGYDGEFGLAMTMDGAIVADRITAGTMYADRIKGGTLTLGGVDNKNGVMKLINKDNDIVCVLDASGAYINGIIESKNPNSGVTLHLENGTIDALQNGERMCCINTTDIYEGRNKPGINMYSKDGIILKCDWLGVSKDPESVVFGVPKTSSITYVTGVNTDSEGKVTGVTKETVEFIHGIMIND